MGPALTVLPTLLYCSLLPFPKEPSLTDPPASHLLGRGTTGFKIPPFPNLDEIGMCLDPEEDGKTYLPYYN